MEIFPGVFTGYMNNFQGNNYMFFLLQNTVYCIFCMSLILASQVQIPAGTKDFQGKNIQCTFKISSFEKVKVKANIQ
jgi:hypothetical protein